MNTHSIFAVGTNDYFPDSKGKYGSEMNNELCFFITVARAAFHENAHSVQMQPKLF